MQKIATTEQCFPQCNALMRLNVPCADPSGATAGLDSEDDIGRTIRCPSLSLHKELPLGRLLIYGYPCRAIVVCATSSALIQPFQCGDQLLYALVAGVATRPRDENVGCDPVYLVASVSA